MSYDSFGPLGFFRQAPAEDLDRVFKNLVLPQIMDGWKNRDAASWALILEGAAYETLIKTFETEEVFRRTYGVLVDPLREIGIKWQKQTLWNRPGPRPRVAFWLPGAAILAHTQQLLMLLAALQKMGDQAPITPLVYIGAPTVAETKRIFEAHGVEPKFLGDTSRPQFLQAPMDLLDRLHEAVKADEVQALVFVSTPMHLLTIAAMQIAPVTIWWSMKWYALNVPDLTERMTPRRGATLEIGGHTWRCGHVCLPILIDDSRKDMRQRLRNRWKIADDQVAIGWMGREEKLSPEFGEAIATLLEANQQAIFVMTGRTRNLAFEEKLRTVAARVRFVGWVDVATTIFGLDVYADSFPMGSGHTAFAAMQAGIPVVTLMTGDNEKNSAAAHIVQLWNNAGGELSEEEYQEAQDILGTEEDFLQLPAVYDRPEYHYELCLLAQDPKERKERGDAQRRFVERFLMDGDRYARQTGQIIVETIAKRWNMDVAELAPLPPAEQKLIDLPAELRGDAPVAEQVDDGERRREETSAGGAAAAVSGSGEAVEGPAG